MVKAKAAPTRTARGGQKTRTGSKAEPPKSDFEVEMYQKNLFLVMVMDMTWQLAVVVIVPLVGGYYLDQFFHTFPGLFIVGILVAALGVVGVMLRIVKEANRRAGIGGKK